MTVNDNATAQKLLKSFMQFKKANWHQRSVDGYKSSEIMVLFCIKNGVEPETLGMKVSEISSLLHVTSPTITQLINGLKKSGLVERHTDQADRRAVRIKLTDQGEAITQKAADAFSNSFNGLIDHLGEDQSNQLAELLFKVFSYFNDNGSDES